MAKTSAIVDTLKQASQGLTVISETDAEFEAFQWSGSGTLDAKAVKKLSGQKYDDDVPVEESTVDSFFRSASAKDKKKFTQLAKTLKDNLEDVKVYKIGEAEKDVYIVGKAKDGSFAGLKTLVVET